MPARPPHILLLTGTPGVGKTTLVRRLAEALAGHSIAGFYTEEIRQAGVRQGFRLVSFGGNEGVIAHVDFDHRQAVGKYGVDVAAIDRLASSALDIVDGIDLYIVDEIGKMECLSPRFSATMRTLLASDRIVVASIARQGEGLIEEAKRSPACELWEVTRDNRDVLLADILAWLRERL